MCPDKKLEWFDPDQAMAVEQLVQQRWSDMYKMSLQAETSLQLNGSCQGHSSLDAPSELNPPQRIPSPLLLHY